MCVSVRARMSFPSKTGCLTKAKAPSLSYYLAMQVYMQVCICNCVRMCVFVCVCVCVCVCITRICM